MNSERPASSAPAEKSTDAKAPGAKSAGLYLQALTLLQGNYFDPAKAKALDSWKDKYSPAELANPKTRDKAIKDLTDSLHDPWTVYTSAADNANHKDLSGTNIREAGIWVHTNGSSPPDVTTVLPGFPAENTPIQRGDKLLTVNGVSTKDKSEDQIEALLESKIGHHMRLQYETPDGHKHVTNYTTKEVVDRDSEAKILTAKSGENALYASLPDFHLHALQSFDDAVNKQLKEAHYNIPMILDLRGNSGGTMQAEHYFDSEYLKDGNAFKEVIRDGAGTKTIDFPIDSSLTQTGSPTDLKRLEYLKNAPLIVLIDDASRSAAESVTASLRARNRSCTVIGTKSFGKGIFFNEYPLGDGNLRISDGMVLSPAGENWHGKGLVPDIIVNKNRDRHAADVQLAAALASIKDLHCKTEN
jgi:carboxyl-terminal processing protease